MKLLINGKNLKLKTKSTGALHCFENLRSLWDMNLDVSFLILAYPGLTMFSVNFPRSLESQPRTHGGVY
jgi:hypothetical protein